MNMSAIESLNSAQIEWHICFEWKHPLNWREVAGYIAGMAVFCEDTENGSAAFDELLFLRDIARIRAGMEDALESQVQKMGGAL